MFMKGESCELRALEGSDEEIQTYTKYVNAGWTLRHVMTGSVPMRAVDIRKAWEDARKGGDILFGIWAEHCGDDECKGMKFIGCTQLASHREIYRSWEFRIIIFDPTAVGHGIGKEATRLTTDYCFQRLNAHRVWLGVNAENLPALKCYLDCGYKIEGTLRDEIFVFGHYCDAIRMGVLESEWTSPSLEAAK